MDYLAHAVKVKVKQSHYRYGEALRVSGGWGSQISIESAHEGGKVVSRTYRPPLRPRKYSWYSFLLEAESAPGPEGLYQWKIPKTQLGIEPATFRLVAQCLNQLRHRVPLVHAVCEINSSKWYLKCQFLPHSKHTAPQFRKKIRLLLFSRRMDASCENHIKHTKTFCWQNVEFPNVRVRQTF